MSLLTKNVVIYHADCLDGFCAAWVANQALPPNDTVYIPAKYGDPLPNVSLGETVYILDFSYPRGKLLLLAGMSKKVVVLDHHKSAMLEHQASRSGKDTPTRDEYSYVEGNLEVVFNMNQSGARLAYDYFHPHVWQGAKWLVGAVEDRDLWRFKISGSEEICLALAAVERTFEQWDLMASSTNDAIQAGTFIKRYRDQQVQQIIKDKVRWVEIGKYYAPTVNTSVLQSDVCHELLKMYPVAPFAATYYKDAKGRDIFSLRSEDKRVDVSEIAKSYGGGGHRNAAGFTTDTALTT